MRRYKLLRDLPTFKAGQSAYISEQGSLIAGSPDKPEITDVGIQLMMYPKTTLEKFPEILTEWFEEVQEPTDSIHWKPKFGDKYWFTSKEGSIVWGCWSGGKKDMYKWKTGRAYRTKEECLRARDRKLAEIRLRRTSTFKPDFENGKGGWVIFYDPREKNFGTHEVRLFDYGEIVRYETEEAAEQSIKDHKQAWLTYF